MYSACDRASCSAVVRASDAPVPATAKIIALMIATPATPITALAAARVTSDSPRCHRPRGSDAAAYHQRTVDREIPPHFPPGECVAAMRAKLSSMESRSVYESSAR
ncbi:MAG: hypothetical protein FJ318_05865 [SAR202 cluster bacterium]|nr:hypothetical protein [SAR202 cluster bacterium]